VFLLAGGLSLLIQQRAFVLASVLSDTLQRILHYLAEKFAQHTPMPTQLPIDV
jgi:hypothetical protein